MIAIVNVDKDVRQSGIHNYELRINWKVVSYFTHLREQSLAECLIKAAMSTVEDDPIVHDSLSNIVDYMESVGKLQMGGK